MSNIEQVVLVIPTLNEVDNIVSLIQEFQIVCPDIFILVADSDSADGTAQVVRENFVDRESVRVLPCQRIQGRGSAVREAYEYIKKNMTVDTVATADADFSHHPDDLPALMEALESVDVVIGSRYVSDSYIVGWPRSRYFFSKLANVVIKNVLSIPVRDCTNGYRVFRRHCLDVLELKDVDANGFITLSQELLKWHRSGFKIAEVPITFRNRVRGKSHFSLTLVWEAVVVVAKLVRRR